jgi:hypothetical protein
VHAHARKATPPTTPAKRKKDTPRSKYHATHTHTHNAHFLILFLRARCIGAQTFLRARSAAKIQATFKLLNAWVRAQADMSSTGENVVVGGENSWSYESFVNYDFFPSESFPILVL